MEAPLFERRFFRFAIGLLSKYWTYESADDGATYKWLGSSSATRSTTPGADGLHTPRQVSRPPVEVLDGEVERKAVGHAADPAHGISRGLV